MVVRSLILLFSRAREWKELRAGCEDDLDGKALFCILMYLAWFDSCNSDHEGCLFSPCGQGAVPADRGLEHGCTLFDHDQGFVWTWRWSIHFLGVKLQMMMGWRDTCDGAQVGFNRRATLYIAWLVDSRHKTVHSLLEHRYKCRSKEPETEKSKSMQHLQ